MLIRSFLWAVLFVGPLIIKLNRMQFWWRLVFKIGVNWSFDIWQLWSIDPYMQKVFWVQTFLPPIRPQQVCQVARLPSCQVGRLPGCQIARLPGCQTHNFMQYVYLQHTLTDTVTTGHLMFSITSILMHLWCMDVVLSYHLTSIPTCHCQCIYILSTVRSTVIHISILEIAWMQRSQITFWKLKLHKYKSLCLIWFKFKSRL